MIEARQRQRSFAKGFLTEAVDEFWVDKVKHFVAEITTGVKAAVEVMKQAALEGLKQELETMLPCVQQVIRQTRARVLGGNTRVEGKLSPPPVTPRRSRA